MRRIFWGRALLVGGALLSLSDCRTSLSFYQCDPDRVVDGGSNSDCDKQFPEEVAQGIYRQCTTDHLCVTHFCDPVATYSPAAGVKPTSNITIGALLRLDPVNGQPSKDQSRLDAIGLAFNELSTSSLNDIALTLLACNTGAGNPARASLAFQEAVGEDHAVAIIGPSSSDEIVDSNGIGRLVGKAGAFVVSPSATYPGLTTKYSDNGLLWTTAPSDAYQGKALAHLFPASESTTDYIVYTTSAYASGLAGAVAAERTALRGNSDNIKLLPYTEGDATGLAAQISTLVAANPPYVVYIADPDMPAFLSAIDTQFMAQKLTATKFFLPDSAHQIALYTSLPNALVANIEGTAPLTAMSTDFDSRINSYCMMTSPLTQAYMCPPDITSSSYTPNAYDAFYLAALGIRVSLGRAGTPIRSTVTGSEIASVLDNISDPNRASLGLLNTAGVFDAYADALINQSTVNVAGVSGPLDYDSTQELVPENIVHWTIQPGNTTVATNFNDSQELTPPNYQLP